LQQCWNVVVAIIVMLSIYLQDATTTTEREDDAKDCNKDTTVIKLEKIQTTAIEV
jgi:hypothetical protein